MMYERIQLNLEGYGLTKLELQIRIFFFFHDFQTTVNLVENGGILQFTGNSFLL